MRLYSDKALRHRYFVGQLVRSDNGRSARLNIDRQHGFDRESEARFHLENIKPEGSEPYLLVEVVAEMRPRTTLMEIVPATMDVSISRQQKKAG